MKRLTNPQLDKVNDRLKNISEDDVAGFYLGVCAVLEVLGYEKLELGTKSRVRYNVNEFKEQG